MPCARPVTLLAGCLPHGCSAADITAWLSLPRERLDVISHVDEPSSMLHADTGQRLCQDARKAPLTSEVPAFAAQVLERLRVVAVDELLLRDRYHLAGVHGVDALRDPAMWDMWVSAQLHPVTRQMHPSK